jgi:hypothetical protein
METSGPPIEGNLSICQNERKLSIMNVHHEVLMVTKPARDCGRAQAPQHVKPHVAAPAPDMGLRLSLPAPPERAPGTRSSCRLRSTTPAAAHDPDGHLRPHKQIWAASQRRGLLLTHAGSRLPRTEAPHLPPGRWRSRAPDAASFVRRRVPAPRPSAACAPRSRSAPSNSLASSRLGAGFQLERSDGSRHGGRALTPRR